MFLLLAQAATAAPAAADATKEAPTDPRSFLIWLVIALIVSAITLAIWAMTRARTPLAGDAP